MFVFWLMLDRCTTSMSDWHGPNYTHRLRHTTVPSTTTVLVLHIYCPSAGSVNVPGMYYYWPDQQTQQSSSRSCRSSSVCNPQHPPPFTEERPSELESRLEVLHSQLNRWVEWHRSPLARHKQHRSPVMSQNDRAQMFVAWYLPVLHQTWLFSETSFVVIFISLARLETRMTADINVILQLLQRQIAPVPPAYSTVSSGTLPSDSPSLYGNGTPVMDSMFSISPRQVDSRTLTQVKTWQQKPLFHAEQKYLCPSCCYSHVFTLVHTYITHS